MSFIQRINRKIRSDGLFELILDGTRFVIERSLLPLRQRKVLPFQNSVYDNDGILMDFDDPNFTDAMKKSIILGQFGPRTEWVEEIVSHIEVNQADVVEIGAGSGFMSCKVNETLDAQHDHIAVEANPALIPTLEHTRSLNDASFIVYNRAYAPKREEVEFKVYPDYKSGTTESGRGKPDEVLTVTATSLSEICETFGLDQFVLYSNMEGMEFEMIDQELDFIKVHCPLVVISFHDFTEHDKPEYIATMDEHFTREWDNGLGTIIYRNPT